MFKSKIVNSGVQRPNIGRSTPDLSNMCFILFWGGRRKARAETYRWTEGKADRQADSWRIKIPTDNKFTLTEPPESSALKCS